MDLTGLLLDHADLSEQTYTILREGILTRKLRPRERISVDEVARTLGVSRTPVMDALKRLAGDGLVEIVPRRGTFVTELTARDVAELFDIRIMIELFAADRILRAGAVDRLLKAVEEPMQGMEQAMDQDDYKDYQSFIAHDRDLHLAIVMLSENQRLIQMYTDMNVHIQVARAHYLSHVENAREAHVEHLAILQSFKDNNADEVRQALSTHITNVKTRILGLLDARGGRL